MVNPNYKLEFDSDKHRYTVNGEVMPFYSGIMASLGFAPNPFWTDSGRAEGSAISLWVNFLGQGKEPATSPDERIAGRVDGYRKFLSDTQFKWEGGELPLFEPVSRFCCMPDFWGYLGNFAAVVEVKRGAKLPTHKLQTAAQSLALKANGFQVQRRYCLYLKDGGYRLEEHQDPQDENRWRVLCSAYYAKTFYGGN